jgi:ketosteroid isomerase-like protein
MNMRFTDKTTLLLLSMLLVACDSGLNAQSGDSGLLKEALLERDAEFAAMALGQGVAVAYQEFLADDAVQLPDGGFPIGGREAIYENILASIDDDQVNLTWEALDGAVSASGDIGYTWGNYYFETMDEQSQWFGTEGKYVNIWRKSAAGVWKVVLDISNQNELLYIDTSDDYGLDEAVFSEAESIKLDSLAED